MVESRSGDGRFTPEHTDAEILAAVRAHDPAATSEIAEEVGVSRQGADRRLRSLREDGDVSSKKIGASLVWFMPRERRRDRDEFDAGDLRGDPTTTLDDTDAEDAATTADAGDATERTAGERNAESGRTRGESAPTTSADPSPGADTDGDTREDTAGESDRLAALVDTVEDTLPGSGAKRDRRRDAVAAAFAYLREHGTATPGSLKDTVYPEHPAEYDTPRSWWKNCVYQAFRAAADRTDAVRSADTTGSWRWERE